VALPPTVPPKAALVPPIQISLKADPALAVGAVSGVMLEVERMVLDPHALFAVTETVPAPEPAVMVADVVF
jgi:hypothetical protein